MERLPGRSYVCMCRVLLGKQVKYEVEGIKFFENTSEQLF